MQCVGGALLKGVVTPEEFTVVPKGMHAPLTLRLARATTPESSARSNARLDTIVILCLQGCSSITDVGLARLWGMQHLGHVVCHNGITDVGLRILTGIQGAPTTYHSCFVAALLS